VTDAVNIQMQVTSFHDGTWGGGVIIGRDVGTRDRMVRARVARRVLPRRPVPGEVWRVTGPTATYPVRDPRTGLIEHLEHVDAAWAAPTAPRGAAIRRWIARNPSIPGVGEGYAERLWDAFGDRLYDVIRARDVQALAEVLDVPKASAIVDAFGLLLDEVTALQELDGMGLDGATASAAVRIFGADAARRFRADPYSMTLLEPWAKVDAAALASGLELGDRRRLLAAVEVAAAQAFRTTGSNLGGNTVVTREGLVCRVRAMLKPARPELAVHAVEVALSSGVLREVSPGRYQARGPDLMEREVEAAVASRLARLRPGLDRATVAVAIAEVEHASGILFEPEQRQAVLTVLGAGVAVINGGAGTGKSTIVKAIVHAHVRLGRGEVVQVALSGRAAKRLAEATGHPAMTVYRFQKDLETGRRTMRRGLLVIDEFSMVGTPDLWQLLTAVPAEIDFLLVGDPAQLPPIKAGNPAQAFCASAVVPRVTLVRVHRQAASTGIPAVAQAIRNGTLPDLPTFDACEPDRPGVFVLPCPQAGVPGQVMRAFAALTGLPDGAVRPQAVAAAHEVDVQVLAMTRHGPAGAAELSDAVERRWLTGQEAIHDWGFRVGSKLLWVRNSYDRPTSRRGADGAEQTVDLMNGALGVIRRPTAAGAWVSFDDGTEAEVLGRDLGDLLRGWAITVHKAQGSAFRTVIIPVVPGRLLDRAMLYTAVTRGRERVVLVGDVALARQVIAAPARAGLRLQALDIEAGIRR
jgi:exodeoxyribonuclease V alpha subunit